MWPCSVYVSSDDRIKNKNLAILLLILQLEIIFFFPGLPLPTTPSIKMVHAGQLSNFKKKKGLRQPQNVPPPVPNQ